MKKRIWQLSLFSFIIAALTGFLYRMGMFYPLPGEIGFANIRHAHSHLMFFNWISPPVLAWMAVEIMGDKNSGYLKKFQLCLYTMMALGFLSFPFFFLYGYQAVPLGSLSLPLAAIISGLVMITWYWYAFLWFRLRSGQKDSSRRIFFDAALIALLASSLGAWGVSVFQFTEIDSPLAATAMTHFFLGVFTEGWVMLGILGLIWSHADVPASDLQSGWLWKPLLFGALLIFPLSLNPALLTPAMKLAANFGLALTAISLIFNLRLMIRHQIFKGFLMKTVGILLSLKVLAQFIAILPFDIWPGEHGLRVFYLHLLLLGIASLTLIGLYEERRNKIAKRFFTIFVIFVLITLAMISGYWPASLMFPNIYRWVTVAAFLPVLPAIWLFANGLRDHQAGE